MKTKNENIKKIKNNNNNNNNNNNKIKRHNT